MAIRRLLARVRSAASKRPQSWTPIASVIGTLLLSAVPASAQLGIAAVIAAATAVVNFINNTIGGLLSAGISLLGDINTVTKAFSNLWQKVVYPISLIAQAQAMVMQVVALFTGLAASIHNVNVLSATLPNPQALQATMLNRSVTDFAQFDQAYRQAYQPLPQVTNIDPGDRQRMDMSDAMAMGTLKAAKASDAVVEQTLQAATIIENEASQAAPGSAAFLTGSGLIAAVENQASMQRMLAAELREEASMLAHDNALRKRRADLASQFRQDATSAFR